MATEADILGWKIELQSKRSKQKAKRDKLKEKYAEKLLREMYAFEVEWKTAFGNQMIDAGLSMSEMRRVIGSNTAATLREYIGDAVVGRPAPKAVEHEYKIDDGFWSFGHLDSKLLVGDEFYVSVTVDDADKYEVVFYENYREGVLTIRLLDESDRDKVDWHAVGEFYNSYKPKHAGWEVVVC